MGIIAFIIVGLIAGLIARALMPGNQSMGLVATTLLGMVGSFVGGLIGSLFRSDGRIFDLLPSDWPLENGVYRMVFDTAAYFKTTGSKTFYPVVEVVFEVTDKRHHHVPLLLSPFGYSTYRGS